MIKDVFDLVYSVGKLLHFPDGLGEVLISSWQDDARESITGLLVASPSLSHVDNPLDRLPLEAINWSSVRCTARGSGGWTGPRGKSRQMTIVVNSINSLMTIRENEIIDSFANQSRSQTWERRPKLKGHDEKEKQRLSQAIIQSRMQPCQILFKEGPAWVWVHPEDVMTLPDTL